MVEAILCDIDGTLVDGNHLHAKAWQRAFAGRGIEIEVSFEEALAQIGKGGDQFVPPYKVDAVEEPLKAYRKLSSMRTTSLR